MLEGISCAGKTSTMYALKNLFATDTQLERNTIMLGEHYTQILNEINGQYVHHRQDEHTQLLFERVEMLEQLHNWACCLGSASQRSRGIYTVLERCYLNHVAHYEDYDESNILKLGERFASLGIEIVLLVISDNLIEHRIRLRDKQMNIIKSNQFYEEQAERATKSQKKLIWALKKINVPSRIINTDSLEWDNYALEIIQQ